MRSELHFLLPPGFGRQELIPCLWTDGKGLTMAHRANCTRKRVLHLRFREGARYPECGYWCVGCGLAQVAGHPALTEQDREVYAALADAIDAIH